MRWLLVLLFSTSLMANLQVEADFLEKMSEHHQSGVKMSSLALERSKNNNVRKLARKMIDDHVRDQKQLQALKAKWYNELQVPQGRISSVNPDILEKIPDNEFDKTYLEMMTKHNKDGIEMMGKMMPNIEKRAIHHMAIKMVKKQGQEISRMEKIQKTINK